MGGNTRAVVAATLAGATAIAIVPAFTGASPAQKSAAKRNARVARNVIVLQGDGMGTAQRNLIRLVTAGNTPGVND